MCWGGASFTQNLAEPLGPHRGWAIAVTATSSARGRGSAAEGMGRAVWILGVTAGRGAPFRNLSVGTLAWP